MRILFTFIGGSGHVVPLVPVARGLGLVHFVLTEPNPACRIQAPEFVERVEKRLRRLMSG